MDNMKKEYWKCRYCGEVFDEAYLRELAESQGKLEEIGIRGYWCPNGCKKPFEQPPYEPPTL